MPQENVEKGAILVGDFTKIETEEQFEAAIAERLKSEEETIRKQFDGYLSPEDAAKKYAGYLSPADEKKRYEGYLSPEEAAKKDATIKGYEKSAIKSRIAHETGLPFEMASRLSGDTEDEIRKDAENLSKLMRNSQPVAPLANLGEGVPASETRAAMKGMLSGLKGE